MFSKFGKYFVCLVLFMFVMTIVADAFTAIRQEDLGGDKPKTRAQRKAHQRRLEEHPEEAKKENYSYSRTTTVTNSNNNEGASSNYGSSEGFVRSSETPTPTPTVDQQAEQEKREKARKTSNTLVIVFILLVIGGLAAWYFTRNVNFKKLK